MLPAGESGRSEVVGLGEVLWDELPQGRVLGGAPANFAFCAQDLGARAVVVSRVGADGLGDEILEALDRRGIDTTLVSRDPALPTGTVAVEVDANGKPSYRIRENVAWDAIESSAATRERLGRTDALCFGSLAQRDRRARASIRELVACVPAESLRIFDVNLRQRYYTAEALIASLELASALKLSDDELPVLEATLGVHGEPAASLEQIARRFDLRLVALTRGAAGSILWADGRTSEHPGVPVDVRDTVGAGDAFAAAMAMGWLAGHSLERIQEEASRVAAFVCTCEGAAPALPTELAGRFREPSQA
jgi:fructokinase